VNAPLFVQKPARWNEPYDARMGDVDVERLMALSPFCFMDPEDFPRATPLSGILRNDTRIQRFRRGDIIVREGDYGTTSFMVLSGIIRVFIDADEVTELLGRNKRRRRDWIGALSQLWTNPRQPEVRKFKGVASRYRKFAGQRQVRGETHAYVRDVEDLIERFDSIQYGAGALFGEIGALSRTPRSATIIAETDVELLEIRYQGLRDLRRYDPAFREYVDDLYRDRSLETMLQKLPLFSEVPADALTKIIESAAFENYGEYEWQMTFRRHGNLDFAEKLRREPVIVAEGDYIDDLLIISFGFVRVSCIEQGVDQTVRFRREGDAIGLDAIIHNWRNGDQKGYRNTIRALGNVDILRIPVKVVEDHLLPSLPRGYEPAPESGLAEAGPAASGSDTDSGLLEFMVENRYINGRQAMLIDTDKCVRCDDCVRACAVAHGNNPRFVRHGRRFANLMVATSCMHCVDPGCLIGCPTGAIHRDPDHGRVVIHDDLCIGCATCANSCSYDNIRMVEVRDDHGNLVLNAETHQPIMKATKCDLCIDQIGGPACERACPRGALRRVDFSLFETLNDLTGELDRR